MPPGGSPWGYLQHVLDACRSGRLDARPCVVVSNNVDAEALSRTRRVGVPNYHLSRQTDSEPELLDSAILETLDQRRANLVVLAGYLRPLRPRTVAGYRGRIIDVHPALLPRHGGQGMYGRRVHEAVLAARDRETGVTIHVVDEEYDHGPIVAQVRIPVVKSDTVDTLTARVLEHEHRLLVETLGRIVSGDLVLPS